MAEPLKNRYNFTFFEELSEVLAVVNPKVKKQQFLDRIFQEPWDELELKARMRRITQTLHHFLLGDFLQQLEGILEMLNWYQTQTDWGYNFEHMYLPDFVEQYGLDFPEASLAAFEKITQFVSCEFAVRPFIIHDQAGTLYQMKIWTKHADEHIRRLATEGCRPRLPWAMALPELKKNPNPILPILSALKSDSSEYVRRSVANNLNDIAKDHPDLVANIAEEWLGQSKETDRLVKHASRNLLRQAHPKVMTLFNLRTNANLVISGLKIDKEKLRIGEELNFTFRLENKENEEATCRVEFAIYFMKANGQQRKKLFKITENTLNSGVGKTFNRRHSFKNLTTRKHYPGAHKVVIVINGKESQAIDFELLQLE